MCPGAWFTTIALASEAGLLLIAAQAGFVDGPRVMANMAVDSWLPHRFAALSERLSMQNGVLLMGVTSIIALVYTQCFEVEFKSLLNIRNCREILTTAVEVNV